MLPQDLVSSHDLDDLHVATALHRLARLGGRALVASPAAVPEALRKRLEEGDVEKLGVTWRKKNEENRGNSMGE